MYHYDAMLKLKYFQDNRKKKISEKDIPILSIVIWIVPIREHTPKPVYVNRVGNQDLGIWQYHEVHLAEMDIHHADPIYLALAPLAPGIGRDDLEHIGLTIFEKAPATLRLVLLGALFQLATWKLGDIRDIEQAILTKVGATMTDILTAVAQSDIGIGLKEMGIAEGEVKALRRLWIKKFGELTTDIDTALKTASDEVINRILDQMIDPSYTLQQARSDLGF